MALIYCVTNVLNNKKYVGATSLSLKRRRRLHEDSAKKNCDKSLFHAALLKNGFHNFKWQVIRTLFEHNRIESMETYYIRRLHSKFPEGYNILNGGLSHKGKNNPMFGKRQSLKCKEINRNMRQGKKQPADLVEKRISKIRGENHYFNNGSKRGKEVKEKLKQKWLNKHPTAKIWVLKDGEGFEHLVYNFKLFCEEKGLSYNSMRGALNKYGHSNGYYLIRRLPKWV